MKSVSRSALRAAMVLAALAGSAAAHPDDPKFWCWHPTAGPVASPQFIEMVRIDLQDGMGNPLDGDQAAYEVVELIKDRGLTSGEVGILLAGFGQGGSSGPLAYYSNTVPLWFHPSDATTSSGLITHPETTPWMDNGITATAAWVADFIDEYENRKSYYAGFSIDIPYPSRMIFDTEQSMLRFDEEDAGLFNHIQTYDSRWDDPGHPVPGFAGQTLEDLFLAASASVQSYTPWQDPNYDSNQQAWFLWYSNICDQAMEAAMDEAVYSQFHSTWGTLCSDYDASLRIDGASGRALRDACNGYSWQAYSWWGYGHLQAPEMYWVGSGWAGGGTPTISHVIGRHRGVLDSIIQSMSVPSGATVTPWITVPGIANGQPCTTHTMSEEEVRRILTLTRAKGITEYNLWAASQPSGSDYAGFNRAKEWVWGADFDGHTVINGTETGGSVSSGALHSNSDTIEIESDTAGINEVVVADFDFISEFDDTTTQLILNTEFWYQGSVPVNAKVQMYDWDIPDWIDVTNSTTGTSRQIRSNVVSTAAAYINNAGEMRVRIIATSTAPFTFETDLIQIVKEAE